MINMEKLHQCFLTKNDCYIKNQRQRSLPASQQDSRYRKYYQGPTHIVVHSTGVNNPWLLRYVQPDDGILGYNRNGNSWNNPGIEACVNAFIGKVDDGRIAVYQTLPWEYRPWGVGGGSKGSYNDCAIQFEICEDDHSDADYAEACYILAAQLCAYLCDKYNIPVQNIVSHHEAYQQGYGSGHVDPDNWWPKFGLSMDGLRKRVQEILDASKQPEKEEEGMTEAEVKKICKAEITAAMDGGGTGDKPHKWAKEATEWAKAQGIVEGFGGADMGWQKLLTREQMAAMLYRFAKLMGKA